jgi:hypothetical protein
MILPNKRNIFIILILLILLILIGSFVAYQMITTIKAHETFEGYCKWRGLAVESKGSDFGYCKNLSTGKVDKIVLFEGRWYLNGDLPCGFLCF